MYVAIRKTGRDQLMPADVPKIKMVRPHTKRPQLPGNFIFEVDKFGAAGPQGRADGSNHLPGVTAESGDHPQDGMADDIGHTAPPAAVNVGHHALLRIEKHHRLAVCRLDQQPDTGHIGNQRIGRHRFRFCREGYRKA